MYWRGLCAGLKLCTDGKMRRKRETDKNRSVSVEKQKALGQL